AAEEFGLALDDVSIVSGDTSMVPFDHGTYSSRVVVSSGLAVLRAAEDAREQLLKLAAMVLGEQASPLLLRGKKICRHTGVEAIAVEEVLRDARCRQKTITATATV